MDISYGVENGGISFGSPHKVMCSNVSSLLVLPESLLKDYTTSVLTRRKLGKSKESRSPNVLLTCFRPARESPLGFTLAPYHLPTSTKYNP